MWEFGGERLGWEVLRGTVIGGLQFKVMLRHSIKAAVLERFQLKEQGLQAAFFPPPGRGPLRGLPLHETIAVQYSLGKNCSP